MTVADEKRKTNPNIRTQGIIRPTWADPRYILNTNDASLTVFDPNASAQFVCAKPNPKRWGLWFSSDVSTDVSIAPKIDALGLGFWLSAKEDKLITAFEYGPLVMLQWIAAGEILPASGRLYVYEIEIH